MFLDGLTEWLAESIVNDRNIVVMGDFNIHINKRGEDKGCDHLHENNRSTRFPTKCKLLYSQNWQHSQSSTDRIFGALQIEIILPGNYISDHCIVNHTISLEKMILKKQTINFRKINEIDITLVENMNLDSIATNNLDEFVDQLETDMQ